MLMRLLYLISLVLIWGFLIVWSRVGVLLFPCRIQRLCTIEMGLSLF